MKLMIKMVKKITKKDKDVSKPNKAIQTKNHIVDFFTTHNLTVSVIMLCITQIITESKILFFE